VELVAAGLGDELRRAEGMHTVERAWRERQGVFQEGERFGGYGLQEMHAAAP